MTKQKKKYLKRAAIISASVLLTIAALISLGFLSFVGFYLLSPAAIFLAFAALVLATIYETKIYFKNIVGFFEKITKRNYLKSKITDMHLRELAKKAKEKSTFLKDYILQNKYVAKLNHKQNLKKEYHKTREDERESLKIMKKSFRAYFFNPSAVSEEMKKNIAMFVTDEEKAQILKEYKQKKLGRLVIIPTIIASISCGVVTYIAIKEGLTMMMPMINTLLAHISTITLSMSSLMPVILGLSVVASIAYCAQIYNAACDMIDNESLKKLWNNISKHLKAGGAKSVLYGIGVLFLVALGVFVTLATAGTWWNAGKKAMALLGHSQKLATGLTILSILFYGLANLVFSLENTHETLESFEDVSIKKTWAKVKKKIKKTFQNENILQWINPFRVLIFLLKFPFRIVGFVLHVLGFGAETDNFGNIWVSFFASAAVEASEDTHYFFQPDGHGHHNVDADHGHDHGDFMGRLFVIIMFIPLYLPAILWDFALSKRNKNEESQLTFKQAWQKLFDTKPTDLPTKEVALSRNWQQEEAFFKEHKGVAEKFKSKKGVDAAFNEFPWDVPVRSTPAVDMPRV